jgi:hypothetical protein
VVPWYVRLCPLGLARLGHTYQGEMAHIVMYDCAGAVMRTVLGEVCYPLELGSTRGLTRVLCSRLARVTNLSR